MGIGLVILVLLGASRLATAANVPIDQVQIAASDPSYVEFYGDPGWVVFNYHILAEPVNPMNPIAGGSGQLTDVPTAPSGTTDAIRIFTGTGNTGNDYSGSLGFTLPDAYRMTNSDVYDQDGDDGANDVEGDPNGDDNEFNLLTSENTPAHWYGVDYNGAGNTVDNVMLGSQLLDVINLINPGTNSPVFTLDQNQQGEEESGDLWFRGVVRLYKDPNNLLGKTAAEIASELPGLVGSGDVLELYLFDDPNGSLAMMAGLTNGLVDETDDSLDQFEYNENPTDDGFLYLPGRTGLDVDADGLLDFGWDDDGDGIVQRDELLADNGDGASIDWGAFNRNINLMNPMWFNGAITVEIQYKDDNNGFEEFYISGGVLIPTPAAATGGLVLLGGLMMGRRIRKAT
ncbi:hypothetical protein HED60_02805 [Planctomycetales bacterium ZRK34]|nr:hypothetical protein HED60_02805 [Planctomycetales bacterium ZRK34]